ncbi:MULTISPECIES: hypothetical protein [Streptomyces]|uniref:hypothetical protein n=1 Tax=Streptomyces TaxID=1883 RepID=UPI001EF75863|nr:hypothetical protein [Streptomyces aureoverticillatus]
MARHPERHSARHAASTVSSASRALLRAGLSVSVAGAALGLGGAAASAAPAVPAVPLGAAAVPDVAAPLGEVDPSPAGSALLDGVQRATGGSLAPVKGLKLNPLAGTGVDPLDNAVGTQVADFKPVSTAMATGPLTQGGSVSELPVVGAVAGVLPG